MKMNEEKTMKEEVITKIIEFSFSLFVIFLFILLYFYEYILR